MSNDGDNGFVEDGGDDNGETIYGSWRAVVSYVLAAPCLVVSFAALVLVVVVSTTRKFTYNVYIVFLLLPEAYLNLVLGIRCIYDGILNNNNNNNNNSSTNPPMSLCVAQQIGIGFYISNVLLNAIVSKEIYALVNNSYHRKRTRPPTVQTILSQVAVVYGITVVFVIWQLLPAGVDNDPYCTARPKTINNVATMVLVAPPVGVVLWTYDRMTRGGLLPINGRTRALALYFMRIFGLFLVFYTPVTVIAVLYTTGFDDNDDEGGRRRRRDSDAYFWLQAAFTILNPMKGTINLYIFGQKDDIQQTFYHYTSKIMYSFLSIRESKTDSPTNSSRPTNHHKIKRNSIWRQNDTYEREGGGMAVVTYLNPDGLPNPSDDDNDDNGDYNDSEDGMDMRMWMSMPFTLRTLSMATTEQEPTTWESTEADTSSPGPDVRNVLSANANANASAAPTANLEALRNLEYFNFNTHTI